VTDIIGNAFWIFVRGSEIFSWELNPMTQTTTVLLPTEDHHILSCTEQHCPRSANRPQSHKYVGPFRRYRVQNGNFKVTFDLQLGLYQNTLQGRWNIMGRYGRCHTSNIIGMASMGLCHTNISPTCILCSNIVQSLVTFGS